MLPLGRYYNLNGEYCLRNLDTGLVVQNESAVKRWCQQQGMDYSVPARLAYFIICQEEWDKDQDAAPRDLPDSWEPVIPRPWDPEDAWRELVDWRHPQLDLNLLQLAIVLKSDYCFFDYFWHPAFLKEEIYRDESGRLVNHPYHLILALWHHSGACDYGTLGVEDDPEGVMWLVKDSNVDPTVNLNVEDLREELLLEERTVDLTAARLQRRPARATQQGVESSDTKQEYLLLSFLTLNGLKTDLASLTLTGSVVPFGDDPTASDAHMVFSFILRKLDEPQVRASTVELLWQVQSDLSRLGFSWDFLHELEGTLYNHRSQYTEDVQLLICQLYWAVKKDKRWTANDQEAKRESFISFNPNDLSLEVCKFIPTEHLKRMLSPDRPVAVPLEAFLSLEFPSFEDLFQEAADAMEDVLKKRTLQDHCVMSILDALNGDARKVLGLSKLTEPLKQLFPVPFQELHKKLKEKEQGAVAAPEQEDRH